MVKGQELLRDMGQKTLESYDRPCTKEIGYTEEEYSIKKYCSKPKTHLERQGHLPKIKDQTFSRPGNLGHQQHNYSDLMVVVWEPGGHNQHLKTKLVMFHPHVVNN